MSASEATTPKVTTAPEVIEPIVKEKTTVRKRIDSFLSRIKGLVFNQISNPLQQYKPDDFFDHFSLGQNDVLKKAYDFAVTRLSQMMSLQIIDIDQYIYGIIPGILIAYSIILRNSGIDYK